MTVPAARELQRRVVGTLSGSQVLGGIGVASGIAVGSLIAEDITGSSTYAGLGGTFQVLGGALIAIPVAALMARRGRRPGLVVGYGIGLLGAALIITAAVVRSFPLLLAGSVLFGGATTSNSQARYAAADLAQDEHRGRDLSVVVWATTIGAVLGPNLTGPGGAVGRALGLPSLAGPFVFSLVGFGCAAALLAVRLRPDPLLEARRLAAREAGSASALANGTTGREAASDTSDLAELSEPVGGAGADSAGPEGGAVAHGASGSQRSAKDTRERAHGSVARGIQQIARRPRARLGLVAMAIGHAVMVSVMVMTPLHMKHGHAELEVIGIVISLHIVGMYAFSPLVGRAVDARGGRPVALVGAIVLMFATGLASLTAMGWSPLLLLALFLLGIGWSCTFVAGSTLLTGALPAAERPGAQGAADVFMGVAAGGGGAVAGVIVARWGYDLLGLVALGFAALIAVAAIVEKDQPTSP